MSKDNNLHDFLQDVADAIKEKKGSQEPINAQSFSEEIRNLPSGGSEPRWTGHADAEGLRAIGWTEEDIAYYQQYGVNWNEEDDEYHMVSDDNKALYGVLTADNIQTYKDRIVYLPKIDTSAKTSMQSMFDRCANMVAIPMIDTSQCAHMDTAFNRCYSLVCLPPLDCSQVTSSVEMFFYCYSLIHLPNLIMPKLMSSNGMFNTCSSMISLPSVDSHSLVSMVSRYQDCFSLRIIESPFSAANITNLGTIFRNCYCLEKVMMKNVKASLNLQFSHKISKESILYIIENEAATEAMTITLQSNAYARLISDADIQNALSAHPNVSLASA